MDTDTYNTLYATVTNCILLPRYKVLIALNRDNINKDLYKTLMSIINTIDESSLYKYFYNNYHNEIIIYFKNGSEIKVEKPNESSRGYKFNTLIIDDIFKSNNGLINCILLPNLRPYSVYDDNGNFNGFKKYVEGKVHYINIDNEK